MPSDCYCAICGSCTDQFQVGTRSEKALRVRSKVLRNRLRPRSEPNEPVSESDDDRSERLYDEEHSYHLSHSYDPQILEGHDTSWITELLLVANDGRKRRAPRTFLCGIATMEPGGFNTCEGTYNGGEKYGAEHYDCEKLPLWRFSDERASLGNYPCHIPCFKMLVRAITSSEDFRQLDIYPLHRAMVHLARYGVGRGLDVDYGDKSGLDQYWESFPGEEVRKMWVSAIELYIDSPS